MAKPIDKQYLIDNMKTFKSVILDPAYIIQKKVLPQASAVLEGVVYQYIGSDSTNYTIGGFYQCQEVTPATTPKTYTFTEITTKTAIDGTTIQENANKEIYVVDATSSLKGVIKLGSGLSTDANGATNVINHLAEISELPTASSIYENKCYLLTADQTGYQRGGTYQCQSDGQNPATYSWVLISVNPLSFNTDDFDVTNENVALQPENRHKTFDTLDDWNTFIEGATSEQKQALDGASIDILEDEGAIPTDVYSTSEVKTNKVWIDGKPIYRKVFSENTFSTGDTLVATNVDSLINVSCYAYRGTGGTVSTSYYYSSSDYLIMIPFLFKTASGSRNIGDVTINKALSASASAWYCILEYTKTT